MAVIAIAKGNSGKGFSVAAVILSTVSFAVTAVLIFVMMPFLRVLPYFVTDINKIYRNYD